MIGDELVKCEQHGPVLVIGTRVAGLRTEGRQVVGMAYVEELECGCERPLEDD